MRAQKIKNLSDEIQTREWGDKLENRVFNGGWWFGCMIVVDGWSLFDEDGG